jgi:hypothetical protein
MGSHCPGRSRDLCRSGAITWRTFSSGVAIRRLCNGCWQEIFDHFERIGIALWVLLWLIDRVTKEHNGVGKVLGGKAVKIGEIASSIKGASYQMVRDQLDLLEQQGYITRKRTAYGFVVSVQNSRKWGVWTKKEIGPREQSKNVPLEQSGSKRLVAYSGPS